MALGVPSVCPWPVAVVVARLCGLPEADIPLSESSTAPHYRRRVASTLIESGFDASEESKTTE